MGIMMTTSFIVKWLFAFSPIFTVLVLMIFKNCSRSRAGAAGWFVALIAATLFFGAHTKLLAYSQWLVEAGKGKSINLYGHGGALLLYSSIISYFVYQSKGFYKANAINTMLKKTIQSGVPTSLGIVSMVCFAMIMDHWARL